ncbi:Adaptive-response sensory-kinase SasA [bioreactor metagenome]|uniref:histidine kinase n=1 Tax=bioreactor metagenome TaxID=1076179 RepID=A0A644WH11_9ZZZZ
MKSMYKRQFLLMAGMVLLSFALLGVVFFSLSYRYFLSEKQASMERNASYISAYTSAALSQGMDIRSDNFRAYISSVAMISDAYVLLAENTGEIVYASNVGVEQDSNGDYLPEWAVNQVRTTGSYVGVTTLSGVFSENRYVAGTTITTQLNIIGEDGSIRTQLIPRGIVFVAAESSALTELWRTFITLFFFTASAVMLFAFIISSVTTQRLTRPLQEMADATYKFAHGEFDTRVAGYDDRNDEIGELAKAFNAMAESLARSEARRSEFVANISHELKTPMTTIAGFADGILDGTIPPERERESLRVISSETRRLSRLVWRMLELSRLQSQEQVGAQVQFDVSEIALRVLVSLETKITARNLDVDAHLPEAPVMVWGDPDAITQVCYNLLDNAIKFSAPGAILGITIAAKAGKAHVTVRNTGETIPPDQLDLVFDRFHKADPSRSENREGVGLGLYIVKTILNAHRENITVTSKDGVTEFTFTLTLA